MRTPFTIILRGTDLEALEKKLNENHQEQAKEYRLPVLQSTTVTLSPKGSLFSTITTTYQYHEA